MLSSCRQQYFYCSFRYPGNKGQQEKAIRMLQSRKIVTVKTINEQSGIFVKTVIKNSYSTTIRPAVALFPNYLPRKATCSYQERLVVYIVIYLYYHF